MDLYNYEKGRGHRNFLKWPSMKEKKLHLKYAVNLSNKTAPRKFCPECSNPKPDDQITRNGNQSQDNKEIIICSNDGIDSESWGVKLEKGMPCSAYGELLLEESQSGQSLRKNESNVSATYTNKNYFTEHWQGKYSLTKSYWINYVVLGVLFQFLLLWAEKQQAFDLWAQCNALFLLDKYGEKVSIVGCGWSGLG